VVSLIGRDRELDQLEAGLEEAQAGRGGVFLVSGVPGIGKTRLLEALGDLAESRQMVPLWGRCWENPGAPAYWPWAQTLRALIHRREPARLERELGGGADWIAEILPELRQRVAGIEPLGPLRSEQARFALFDAVTTFLRNASECEALVVELDDLHAADRESLALLDYVARSVSDAPVMVSAAYQDAAVHSRDAEVEKLFSALQVKARHVALGGVSEAEIALIVEAELGTAPPADLVAAVYETTEGNPLFAREVARLIAAEGQVEAWRQGEPADRLPLPDTVRETIRRRLEPLGSESIEVLQAGAVVGREFRLATVERVVVREPDFVISSVDDARTAGLVTEVPAAVGRIRFTHGLVREVLYAELTTAERIRMHRAVGEALEHLHGDAKEHLAELAHHFAQAAPAGDAEKALGYAARAGNEAMRVLAYQRAAELFELALEISEDLPFDRERHAQLVLGLGIAQTRAGDPRARETLLNAAEHARALDRPEMLAQAALGIHVFNLTPGVPDEGAIALLEEALERIGPGDGVLRARLLARIATALYYRIGTADRREALVTEAVAMARRIGDPATLAYVLINGQLGTWGPDTTERDLEWVDELLVLTEEAGNAELALATRTRQIDYLLELDDLVGADIALLALARTAEESPDPRARAYLPLQRARRAALEGSFEVAEECNAEAANVGVALEDRMVQLLAAAQVTMLRWTQGRLGEVVDLLRGWADAAPAIVGWRAALARAYCDLGRDAEARRELERLDQRGFSQLPRYNGWLNMMALLSEVCAHLGDARRAAALYELLLPFERRNVVTAQCVFDGPVTRFLGILATTTGEWDLAERHFESARKTCARQNARPFVALVDVDEARMLAERDLPGDRARALGLIDGSIPIAEELGIEKVVERAEQVRLAVGDVEAAPREAARSPAPAAVAAMRREGDVWALEFGGRVVRIRNSKGVHYLAVLVSSPGVEIHSLELAGAPSDGGSRARATQAEGMSTFGDDAGPALDPTAKARYRRRIEELREEVEEAESFNDPERVSVAREEMEFIARELSSAVGLGGRDRKLVSRAERARVAVTKAVRATVKRIGEMSPELGQELDRTIRTGTFCSYEPDLRRPISWTVEGH
jgi:tetratricopeptide (TPR) repeat protein